MSMTIGHIYINIRTYDNNINNLVMIADISGILSEFNLHDY